MVLTAPRGRLSAAASAGRPATLDDVGVLQSLLRNDAPRALDAAPSALGAAPSVARAAALLDDAEGVLRAPAEALAATLAEAGAEERHVNLPVPFRFPGYDPRGRTIRIDPARRQFETRADWAAWVVTAVTAWGVRLATPKPPFPRHDAWSTGFRYPLRTRESDGAAVVALFSDWGTGYYHARYIAKHAGTAVGAGQAIHLGDIYYTGTASEFARCFDRAFDRWVLRQMPFYALNANHEMDSHGIPYFGFLEEKRRRGRAGRIHEQPQEGSYFCLSNERYQVIALDTAYFGNGRCNDPALLDWLRDQLHRGRERRQVNILLTQSEPYGRTGARPLLADDLAREAVADRLVDLWFWGDEHHCALYHPSDAAPFVGSCIGHGGYPYSRRTEAELRSSAAELAWGETAPRFPEALGLRPGRGNNGFCRLALGPDVVELTYYDWRLDLRHARRYAVRQGRLDPS